MWFSEVHLVFVKPLRIQFNPKKFEHDRRDANDNNSHTHKTFQCNSTTDMPWQELISCRTCKFKLVQFLGQCLFRESRFWINGSQKFILSGCFSGQEDDVAWIISSSDVGTIPQPEPLFHTNSEEADHRVWMHAANCQATNVLI